MPLLPETQKHPPLHEQSPITETEKVTLMLDKQRQELNKLQVEFPSVQTMKRDTADDTAKYYDAAARYRSQLVKIKGELMNPSLRAENPQAEQMWQELNSIDVDVDAAWEALMEWRPGEESITIAKSDGDLQNTINKYADDLTRLSGAYRAMYGDVSVESSQVYDQIKLGTENIKKQIADLEQILTRRAEAAEKKS